MLKFIVSAMLLVASTSAFANELLCSSKKDETLYFTDGQIRVTAKVINSEHLQNVEMISGGNPGFTETELVGKKNQTGKYIRFQSSDAWCNYTITLPAGFMTRDTTVLFLDAKCEEGNNSEHRLNCRLQ